MAEENIMEQPAQIANEQEVDYIGEIEKLKKSTVDKALYEKQVADNKRLMQALVDNRQIEPEKPKTTIEEYKKRLSNFKGTNLDYWENVLGLRTAVIEEGGSDPFMNDDLIRKDPTFGERVAEQMSKVVEACNGNPKLFQGYYESVVKESVSQKEWDKLNK